MKCTLIIAVLLLLMEVVYSQDHRTFIIDYELLKQNKNSLNAGNAGELAEALAKLKSDADNILKKPIHSVVQKKQLPASRNKHDYYSLATYWWPDPSKPNGLPYIPKDGKANPEVGKIRDWENLKDLARSIQILGVAYFYTNDETYVANAVKRLRTWFLDKNTCMNPNLNYAQAIKGKVDGRREGIIDTRSLVDLIDGIQLLSNSRNFSENDLNGIKNWFANFLSWMQTSKIGQGGAQLVNNIGTAYYMQLIAYSVFVGKNDIAKQALNNKIPRLVDIQFDLEGKQPKELSRTNAYSYSLANLEYWFKIAELAEHVGVDVWNLKSNKGASVKAAYEWLIPYGEGDKAWDYQQLKKNVNFSRSIASLKSRGDKKYTQRANKVVGNKSSSRSNVQTRSASAVARVKTLDPLQMLTEDVNQ